MKILRRIYSTYGLFMFALIFFLMLPVFYILIQTNKKRHPIVFALHRIWAVLFYAATFMPIKRMISKKVDFKKQYIYCSNHFSYLDIPALGINPIRPVFVGKSSLGKVPFFGYMYRNIHITLDRKNLKSRYNALQRCADELDHGNNLVIFPEGGIASNNPPALAQFKDGAFRLAIEKQIPIVPVTIPYNWIILPDDGKLLLQRHKNEIVFHDPIETKGMKMDDEKVLKSMVFQVIDAELKRKNGLGAAKKI